MKRIVAALSTILLTAWLLVTPSPAYADSRDIDNSSLESVRDAYLTWLRPALEVPQSWDGDPDKCVTGQDTPVTAQPAAAVGTFSEAGQEATLDAINYFREMAGLRSVTEKSEGSALAQQAALIMRANRKLTHEPTPDMACYSIAGAQGAGASNLSIGWVGARAIASGFIDDPGDGNVVVGHRRWVLYPPLSGVGIGSTDQTTSMVVFGNGTSSSNPHPNQGTAWPSAGYVPWEVMPTSGRWSYSVPRADFASATVAMKKNGAAWPVSPIARNGGYGDPALVWQGDPIAEPAPGAVDTYDVAISGIAGGPVNYQVKVFPVGSVPTPPKEFTKSPTPTISGTAQVGKTLTAKPGNWSPSPGFVSYQWYRDGEPIAGATSRTYLVDAAAKDAAVTVGVTAGRTGYETTTRTSKATKKVKAGTITAAKPTITGTARVDRILTAVPGTWQPETTTFSYQWYRNSSTIKGATGATYTLKPADKGKKISVKVTGRAAGYTTKAKTSAKTGKVGAA
ncbi:MAG: CAP domain-containing protein [Micropruina sp.]|uniref:CAP domain-containing protein n=1 Tax=Micropruina sp. TaxID=2737536 RepID=UPI0039E69B06